MLTDSELLRQYVEDGSEAAFTELVRRYAGLVHAAAWRLVGGKAHLARDVTQDVFILLARKAPMLIGHKTLAGWLHASTRYIALCMIRNLQKRETLEREAAAMQTISAPDVQWEQLRPLLDKAGGQLDDRDRDAVLLRYFQGQSHREVGAALGMSEDSARVRTDRAVEKLRRHFARSGVVTTAALLTEALSANAAQAAPPGLVADVAAVAHAKGLSLGHTFLKVIYMTTKTKIAIVTAALVALIAAVPLQIESRANTRLQGELDVAQKQANMLKAGQHKLETQLADQSLELQILRAQEKSSLAAGTGTGSITASSHPVVNPRAPSPGLYPNHAKFMDMMTHPDGTGEDSLRYGFSNLFQKMQFTPEQIDAFVKIQMDKQKQQNAITLQNTDPQLLKNLRDGIITRAQAQATADQNAQRQQAQLQAVEDSYAPQIQQLMGNMDNYAYYQTYLDQGKERGIIQGLSEQAQLTAQTQGTPGVPPLTVDQEEQLVNLFYQYHTAASGNNFDPIPPEQAPEILQKAGAFLSPEQLELVKPVLPMLMQAYHQSSFSG